MGTLFYKFSNVVARACGSAYAFLLALFVVLTWFAFGPHFYWSDSYNLVINTGTTIVTFLMVFLLQATQNRESAALHAKLDEVISALPDARNELIAAEEMVLDEIAALRARNPVSADIQGAPPS